MLNIYHNWLFMVSSEFKLFWKFYRDFLCIVDNLWYAKLQILYTLPFSKESGVKGSEMSNWRIIHPFQSSQFSSIKQHFKRIFPFSFFQMPCLSGNEAFFEFLKYLWLARFWQDFFLCSSGEKAITPKENKNRTLIVNSCLLVHSHTVLKYGH